jgi:hypothetical protein
MTFLLPVAAVSLSVFRKILPQGLLSGNRMDLIKLIEKFDNNDLSGNALRMLRLVHNLQSFSKAAEVLEVNQSTASDIIGDAHYSRLEWRPY